MTTSPRKPRGAFRRFERWLVGLALWVMAFVLEKAVARSLRRQGRKPAAAEPGAITTKGADAEVEGPG